MNFAQTSVSQSFPCGGVDGAKGGWALAWRESEDAPVQTVLLPNAETVWKLRPWRSLWWDMPVGLPHRGLPVRKADLLARQMLPGSLKARVFLPPSRLAVERGWDKNWRVGHPIASTLNRAETGMGLSLQAYHLIPKIRELDLLLRLCPEARSRCRESHPELAFACFNGGRPLLPSKKTGEGQKQRYAIVTKTLGENLALPKHPGASHDDWLDSLVLLASAAKCHSPCLLPDPPETDSCGLGCCISLPGFCVS